MCFVNIKNIVHGTKPTRASGCICSNESDDNEKYLIWYSYACLVRAETEIFSSFCVSLNILINKEETFQLKTELISHKFSLCSIHWTFLLCLFSGESNLFEYKREKGNNFERKMLQIISSRLHSVRKEISQEFQMKSTKLCYGALRGSLHWRFSSLHWRCLTIVICLLILRNWCSVTREPKQTNTN